jgi:CRISPR-associated protein Cas5h
MGQAMDVIVFDIFADYGHFKVPYTTTSPLTLPVPSKTAVYGIIGAIMGFDKGDYLTRFQDGSCRIAIGVKKPIRKTHIAENLINTKNVTKTFMFARMNSRKAAPRTQVKIEFLKEPGYRIYISHSDKRLLEELLSLLKEHKSVYTISFGISECLANFEYIGFYQAEDIQDDRNFVRLNSILPLELISSTDDIKLDDDKYYIRTHIPLEMKPDRELVKTGDFLIEANGETITAKVRIYHEIPGLNEKVIFF